MIKRIVLFAKLCSSVFGAEGLRSWPSSDRLIDSMPWMNPVHINKPAPNNRNTRAEELFGYINYGVLRNLTDNYNELAKSQNISHAGIGVGFDKASEDILNYLSRVYKNPQAENLKVADLGCGQAHLVCLMSYTSDGTKPVNIYAVDGVDQNVLTSIARKDYIDKTIGSIPNVTHYFMQGMLQNLETLTPFSQDQDGTFDLVICQNVLHLMAPEEKIRVINSLWRLLKPGGVIFFSHIFMNARTNYPKITWSVNDGIYCYPVTVDPNGNIFSIESSKFLRMEDSQGHISPQSFLLLEKPDEMKIMDIVEVTKLLKARANPIIFHFITEKVSEASLRQKCLAAGIDTPFLKVTKYAFDVSKQTTFARVFHQGQYLEDLSNAFLVMIRKPLIDI